MNQSHAQLFKEAIGIYSNLNLKELSLLLKLFGLKKFKNKEHIIRPDEDNSSVFFIVSGLVRYYYLTSDGKEWNRSFLSEHMISTSFSQDMGNIDPYGIQALEDTTVLIANFSDFELLFDENQVVERLHRKLVESILIKKMNRERSFLQSSAKMRYIDFLKQYPNLSQRVTQYHLASYLGITEPSLSRIISEFH